MVLEARHPTLMQPARGVDALVDLTGRDAVWVRLEMQVGSEATPGHFDVPDLLAGRHSLSLLDHMERQCAYRMLVPSACLMVT